MKNYIIDNIEPVSSVVAASVEDIFDTLKNAYGNGNSVLPWGGGTRIYTGNIPNIYDIALDLSAFNSIVEYDPEELLVIVKPGASIDEINRILAKENQFIALNPPFTDRATIGGTLASNSQGFLRERYGTARDMVLGMEFIKADGTVIRSGGRVEKNVAGYDMSKLMIGSWGSLGIISEIAIRTQPVPEKRITCYADFSTLNSAFDSAYDILDSHFAPAFLLVLNKRSSEILGKRAGIEFGEGEFKLIIGIEGLPETVDWQSEKIRKCCKDNKALEYIDVDGRNGYLIRKSLTNCNSADYNGLICKMVSTRTGTQNIINYYHSVDSAVREREPELLCQLGCGVSHILLPLPDNPDDGQRSLLMKLVHDSREYLYEHDGWLTIEKAPVWLKEKINIWPQFTGVDMMRKLKFAFDPKNILNPERFISNSRA